MTDKDLGAAAGDIFAKAFTLGYETGRNYIPSGGMALTAEQVEDVRALVWLDGRRNFDAFHRLRALFPATEPAEAIDDVDDSRAQDIARAWMRHLGYSEGEVDSLEHAKHEDYGCEREDGGWSCYGESGDSLHKDWDEYDNTAQIVMFVLERSPGVTPAEPAEEETKADGPGKFRKKPVEVEAMQYDGKDWRSIAQWMAAHGAPMGRTASGLLRIHTLEGEMTAGSGDWIIRGVQGEFYPCKPDIFEQTYDPASSPVVPAPTETGPWQRIEDVPVGVPFKDREGSGLVKLADSQFGYVDNYRETSKTLAEFAPFVAVAEEG